MPSEPGTLTEHKLRTIKDIGVTRLSLGVEHYEDRILKLNGRAHGSQEIDRAIPIVTAPDVNGHLTLRVRAPLVVSHLATEFTADGVQTQIAVGRVWQFVIVEEASAAVQRVHLTRLADGDRAIVLAGVKSVLSTHDHPNK